MKFSQILTSLLLLSVATARTTKSKTSQTSESKAPKTTKGCGGTNCNRAIYGTHQNVASRYSDCLSYFSTTVTAPQRSARCQRAKQSLQYNGINSTSTSTVTVYTILGNDAYVPPQTVKKRDGPTVTVFPTSIPFYASDDCQATKTGFTERYVSACRCAGATSATTTVNVPSTSTVTTTTVTVSSFKVAASAAALNPTTNQFMVPDERIAGPNYLGILFTPTDPNAVNPADLASVWSLHQGYLQTYLGQLTQQDAGATSQWIWVDTLSTINANGWQLINFIVDPVTLEITAQASSTKNTVLQVCILSGVPYLALAAVAGTIEQTTGSLCYPITLMAVPV